jgi:hypothetical protein
MTKKRRAPETRRKTVSRSSRAKRPARKTARAQKRK